MDFAGPVPTRDSAVLLDIWSAFSAIQGQLAELIYAGAPYQIKHGQRVNASFYGPATMGIHHDHVHVAVEAGWRWSPPGGRSEVRRGSHGDDVRYLQSKLGVSADGDFGPGTEGAVRTFQATHGLVVDGTVGPATWNALG